MFPCTHECADICAYICILLLVKHRLTTHKAHNKIKMLLNDCPSNVLSHTRGYSQAESFICQAIIVTAIRRRNQSLCRKVRTIHGQEAIGTLFSWPGHLKTVHQFSTPQSHRTLYKWDGKEEHLTYKSITSVLVRSEPGPLKHYDHVAPNRLPEHVFRTSAS